MATRHHLARQCGSALSRLGLVADAIEECSEDEGLACDEGHASPSYTPTEIEEDSGGDDAVSDASDGGTGG
eukprot:CAMPEP_0204218778 /NCGR_PEP_ID=MMETSP0361-20130328/79866_1 /ASSEMBLY_ACC=CAM_ASM_000343 /TAXON_ID=268821 /ORGANISM="Scrippsiella Hangoei, Strain SHTV-5" /LENGTH=70 /DNA_ID=CAMNT_0051183989 /DNA_START=60 /DNA_END=269 /DNA_ORIENTATION=+